MREKLIQLINESGACFYCFPLGNLGEEQADKIADHLIANGVALATDNNVGGKWIPVSERLPEYEEPVMGWDAELRDIGIVNFVYGRFFDTIDMSEVNVTHWMPLPEPPKEDPQP